LQKKEKKKKSLVAAAQLTAKFGEETTKMQSQWIPKGGEKR